MADIDNINIPVGMDTRPATKVLKDFMRTVANSFKKTNVNELNKSLRETEKEAARLTREAEKARKTLEQLNSGEKKATGATSLEKGIERAQLKLEKFTQEFNGLVSGNVRPKSISTVEEQTEKAQKALNKLVEEYKNLLSGKTEVKSITKLITDLGKADANTEKLIQRLKKMGDMYEGRMLDAPDHPTRKRTVEIDGKYFTNTQAASMRAAIDEQARLADEIVKSQDKATLLYNRLKELSVNKELATELVNLENKITNAKDRVEELQAKSNNLTFSAIQEAKTNMEQAAGEVGALKEELATVNSTALAKAADDADRTAKEADKATAKVAELRAEVEEGGSRPTSGGLFSRMFGSMRQLDHMFKRMTTRLLFYNTFGKTIRAFTEYLGRAVRADSNLVYSLGALKAAFATTFQYIWSVVGPILSKIIAIILNLVNAINRLLGLITGRSLKDMQKGAKALAGYGTAAKGATKEIKKTLAAFDELIQIGDKDEDAGGGGSGGGEGIPLNWDDNLLKGKLSELDIYVAGAMLAVGAILTFTGANVPLGLGLMAAGAAVIASALAEDWDTMPRNIKSAITKVLIVLGTAALVIGAILVFSSANIPLGIGLMVAGAAALGTAAKLNWDSIERALKGSVGVVLSLLLTALLVIGAILTFSGAHPVIGIGLMIAGAAGLAAMVNLNWDSMSETLKGPLLAVLGLLATYMIIVGMVLAMSGVSLPLGIGLIAAGAIILGKAVVPRWDTIKKSLQGPLGEVMALIGTFLIVIGVVLLFSGAGIPLGLGILVAGGATLAAPIAANWDLIKEKIKGAWESIKQYWNTNIKQIFTIAWWTSLLKVLPDSFRSALNVAITVAEKAVNAIVKVLNTISFDVPDWVIGIGGKHFGFNLSTVTIPRLAQGAVIPPNREFMALLGDQKHGTNIETPLDTMIQAFTEALDNRGTQTVNIKFEGNLAQLARVLKPYLDDDDVRQGTRRSNGLIVGGSY